MKTDGHLQTKERGLKETKPADTLILDLASRTVRKQMAPGLGRPELTKTGSGRTLRGGNICTKASGKFPGTASSTEEF